MRSVFVKAIAIPATLYAVHVGAALATPEIQFAQCYGDHHGSYLDFVAEEENGIVEAVTILVSGDGEEVPVKKYRIESVTKDGAVLQPKAYSWAIRQAIKAEAAGNWYGFIFIKAKSPSGSIMSVNLQKYTGSLRHALAIDGYIEELTCPGDLVRDSF